ncbi:MAG: translation elongation factor Ts, elongation factor Ts [Candidatus Peregrinibacteria bacterium GW2011_GWF2_39_17]|nr:MAG: translation elongation factor Ts, elongation factor Ts [Candidatus Peregrinibacteria bacterium GW2011_GWF2_39_17]HCW32080.1 translation elongation factor Ts [Candidatus Peregrinibacteria bacterium]
MINLETIKELREKSGASLQACKKAIEESDGDMTRAIQILREKGEAKAASRSDRETSEGVAAVATKQGKGVILHLGCETDFVAKNAEFIQAAENIAKNYLAQGKDYDPSILINELNLKMGEKVAIDKLNFLEGENVEAYIHSNRKIGTLIALSGGNEALARDIAMHITAMNPIAISPDQIPTELIQKEREIWTKQLKDEGKPDNIILKILEGKEKKFREENSLLKQAFVKNSDESIEQILKGITIKEFVRL